LAVLAVLLRLAEVAIHYVATLFSLVALVLLSGVGYLKTFQPDQLDTLARVALSTQGAGMNLGFILLGLGSTVFAYLLLRSGYVPKVLAAWGVFSSLLLAMSAVALIVFPAVGPLRLGAMVPMFIYGRPWLLALAEGRKHWTDLNQCGLTKRSTGRSRFAAVPALRSAPVIAAVTRQG
jgi:hypothetical protein